MRWLSMRWLKRMRRCRENFVDIVSLLFAGINDIALQAVKDLGRVVLARAEQVDRSRQFFPLDHDIFDCVFRHFVRCCDHRRHDLAHVPHAVHRQRQMAVFLQREIAAGHGHRFPLTAHIVAGNDGHDAVAGGRRAAVDAHDIGVGVGAAHESHVAHAGQLDITNVFAGAGD